MFGQPGIVWGGGGQLSGLGIVRVGIVRGGIVRGVIVRGVIVRGGFVREPYTVRKIATDVSYDREH